MMITEIKCTIVVMLLIHPKTVPHTLVFHKTGPWCQKGGSHFSQAPE